jgi:hypothetical protein
MAETPIVSSSLQQNFRTTFPSQVSSGRDLHVSDVIVPIVDFSSTATGGDLSANLNNAIDYAMGSFSVVNTTTTIINTTGFWRILFNYSILGTGSDRNMEIFMNDGTTDKIVYQSRRPSTVIPETINVNEDLVFYIHTNHSLKIKTDDSQVECSGSFRQIADINGNATAPLNFVAS